jgi:hypothetical protein
MRGRVDVKVHANAGKAKPKIDGDVMTLIHVMVRSFSSTPHNAFLDFTVHSEKRESFFIFLQIHVR